MVMRPTITTLIMFLARGTVILHKTIKIFKKFTIWAQMSKDNNTNKAPNIKPMISNGTIFTCVNQTIGKVIIKI